MAEYNKVYTEQVNKLEEVNPEYVYLTIPANYICTYHKLLVLLADFGINILEDCKAGCKGISKNIITCWNMFQSACACHTIGKDKQADVFIKYIEAQLEIYYKGSEQTEYNNGMYLPITEDGKIKALCSCKNEKQKFEVDLETGNLYRKYIDEKLANDVFTIKDEELNVANYNNDSSTGD